MKVGDLVRIVQGGKLIPPWLGKTGVIVDEKACPRAGWFTVFIGEEQLIDINIDYLEKIDEDR